MNTNYFKSDFFSDSNILRMINNLPKRIIVFSPCFRLYFPEFDLNIQTEKFGDFHLDEIQSLFKTINPNIQFKLSLIYFEKGLEYYLDQNMKWVQVIKNNNILIKKDLEKRIVSIFNYRVDDFGLLVRI